MLPDISKHNNFAFGVGPKNVGGRNLNYDEISDIQRIEPLANSKHFLESELGVGGKKHSTARKRGLHTQIQSGLFKFTDIERNSALTFINGSKLRSP